MKNLVIQAQRLGDLVMSYPLFAWMKAQDDKELFVLAEEKFYSELIRISPAVTYIPVHKMEYLKNFSYDTIINLSHRTDTAVLAGSLECNKFLGRRSQNNIQQIYGKWQLYRASLTHNNHYNRLHWADLNALDSIGLRTFKAMHWPVPQGKQNGLIGIFVGASEEAKRPSIDFWADFALQLNKKGYSPVFISGPSAEEKETAFQCAKKAKIPRGVIPGTLSIVELIAFLENLQLFVCPDTGPMHIASFAGVPTVNISLGPVHPWETAPYPPGHYVLRSSVSCSGCWQCTKEKQLCRSAFVPHRIANLIHSLVLGKTLPQIPGLTVWKTGRNPLGLYELKPILNDRPHHAAQADFWRYFFLYALSGHDSQILPYYEKGREELFSSLPRLRALLLKEQIKMLKTLILTEKNNAVLDHNAWQMYPPFLRPLSSYIQLLLENGSYEKTVRLEAMALLEDFKSALA